VMEWLLKFSQSNPLGMAGFISISIRAMLRANPGSNCNAFAVNVELRKVRTPLFGAPNEGRDSLPTI
jgi:hypothetical protein